MSANCTFGIVLNIDHGADDQDVYHGAPVAVQITGCRLTEERAMAILNME